MAESADTKTSATEDADIESAVRTVLLNDTNRANIQVRAVAIVGFMLLLVSFFVIVSNMYTISSQAETIRSGPYPVSVAAGHVETDVARIQTVVEDLNSMVMRSDESREEVIQRFDDVDADMLTQLNIIMQGRVVDRKIFSSLRTDYHTLKRRMSQAFILYGSNSVSNEETAHYTQAYIEPLIASIYEKNTYILNEATDAVDRMYDTVTRATDQTIILTCVILAAALLVGIVFVRLLRKKNEREEALRHHLEVALELAQSASVAKSDFLSNMSHDIRTPMNAIMGLTTIALDNMDDKIRVEQCLTRISTSSNHLLSLINDVLDMNKIESGKVSLNEEKLSLPHFVSEIITIVQPQAREKNLKADIIISHVDHETLISDPMRLRQVILNLMSNAIKYTNEGDSVRLIISEDNQTEEGYANLQFVVDDSGIGMTPSFLKHIFEPFERERNDFTNFTEGTGLGMAITKNLVELMGGTIDIKSQVDVGSTFTVRIPMKIAGDEPQYDIEGLAGKHVLVVDSNYLVAQNALSTLQGFDMVAQGVTSAQHAVDTVLAAAPTPHSFDVVLLDLSMANMNSIEVMTKIREGIESLAKKDAHYKSDKAAGKTIATELQGLPEHDDTKLIKAPKFVLASYGWNDDQTALIKAGASAFIAKPLFKSRLYETMYDLCVANKDAATPTLSKHKDQKTLKGRVLLVDDNEINMEIGAELISRLGPEVESAFDGLQAVAKVADAEDSYYDMIFMDCQMPQMDGYEATRSIIRFCEERGRKPIPIIAMTANAFDSDRQNALDAGMVGFIPKPINVKDLEDCLKEYLG